MKAFSSMFKVVLFLSFIPFVVFGQSTLRGTVSDSSNRETIIGANVILIGTSLGCATDIEGVYRITGIPARIFPVKISCIGYETKIVEIDFSKSTAAQLDVQLKPVVIRGEEVVVTAQMRGQIAAINQQVTSKTIINVVSEEKIQELPDANAAEAIGRLPGVSIIRSGGEATSVVLRGLSSKFSNITIDGVKIPPTDPNTRDVDLSTISQGSLAGIELHKTLTPDQDADAIAGTINLVTRKAPSERLVRLDLKGDYNYLMKSAKQYDFSLRYGERFFDDFLGVQLQGSTERKIRSKEDISYGYGTSDNQTLPTWGTYDPQVYDNDYNINQFTVQFTDELRKRNGGQAIFDINTPDSGSVKLTGVYSETGRDIMEYERNYPAGTGGYNFNYQYSEQKISTFNSSLQGKNYLLGLTVDWNASYADSRIKNPFGFRLAFQEPNLGSTFSVSKDHPELNIIPFVNDDFNKAVLDSSKTIKQENFDKEQTFLLNVSKKITLGNMFTNELKAGGKYKIKSRWMNTGDYAWNNYRMFPGFSNPDGTPIDFTGTRFENANTAPALSLFIDPPVATRDLLSLYRMTPLISVDALKQWATLTQHGIFPQSPPDYGPNGVTVLSDYSVMERVSSAYLMNTLDIGQSATFIFGVRVEKEANDYGGKFSDQSVGGTGYILLLSGKVIDTTAKYSETIWLPSAQLSLKPTDFLTVRLAAYRALARPDYNLRMPQFSFNDVSGGTNLVTGNPDLKDSKAWNFEVNTQIYNNWIGLFSISAFYKKIDDLFHQSNNVNISWPSGGPNTRVGYKGLTTNDSAGYYHRLDTLLDYINLSSWKNNPYFEKFLHNSNAFNLFLAYNSPTPSYAWGIEIEHQMNFGFLPLAWLQHIVLSYNVSITRSKTDILFDKSVIDSAYVPGSTRPPRPESYNLLSNKVATFVTRESENQPEVYANIALGYDLGGFSARISVYYQDKYTRQYSADGTSDAIVDAFTKWDLAFKQQVMSHVSLFLNVNNIFNKKESTSRHNNIFDWGYLPRTSELYGTSLDCGVRVSL